MRCPPDPIGTTSRNNLFLQGQRTTDRERHRRRLALSQRNIQAATQSVSGLQAWSLDAPVILIGGWPDPKARIVRTGDLLHLLPFDAITCGAALGTWQGKPQGSESPRERHVGPEPPRFGCSRLLTLLQESRDGFARSPRELLVVLFKEERGGQPQLTSFRLRCGIEDAAHRRHRHPGSRLQQAAANALPTGRVRRDSQP